jgi:hypothetical protein
MSFNGRRRIGLQLAEHLKMKESEAKSRWPAGPLKLI